MSVKQNPDEWIVKIDGKMYGPATRSQLQQWVAEGRIQASDLVRQGQGRWVLASSVVEFKEHRAPKPPPHSIPAKAPTANATNQSASDDVFEAIESINRASKPSKVAYFLEHLIWMFDFGFKRYLAPNIIRGIWILSILMAGGMFVLATIGLTYSLTEVAKQKNDWRPVYFSPLLLFMYFGFLVVHAIILRIVLEFLIAVFNISDSLKRMEKAASKSENA